ncbi:OmpW family outer membrane protein [Halomonas sp. JS92-SW72]|uniref:OmpW/AlkL family protein n=1 Tax=Halomonas sp. JS92-SW72 TaxID=2306583 RepID=UPI000E5BD26C|nr:OmpW family outer membrane protein [Halomonas sp. JS92-SW72]AXY40979.1 OmpW family protein [Halomonas sp. JS92-SW72]
MNKHFLLTAALLSAGGLVASQAALAYQAGDIFVRGGIAQTDVKSNNGNLTADNLRLDVSDERGLYYGVGYLFTDNLGIELSGQEKVEHSLNLEALGDIGSVDRMPINLLVNYYPMGGMDSRVQPYVGAGLNYTRFSGEDTPLPIDVRRSYGAIGQLGVDLAVAQGLMLNGFVSYADVSADVRLDGDKIGEAKIDPMTIGGGITYRF